MSIGKLDWVAERSGGETSISGRSFDEPDLGTVVYVGIQGQGIVGYLAFEDTLRDDASDVIARLKRLGITTMLLSGDSQRAATQMAVKVSLVKKPYLR